MRQDQRQSVRLSRALMDEMNIETVDIGRELIELIEPPLVAAPYVPIVETACTFHTSSRRTTRMIASYFENA